MADLKQKARACWNASSIREMEELIAQCVAEEREACAKIAEFYEPAHVAIAAAIRVRRS